jgi:hypothetical protein
MVEEGPLKKPVLLMIVGFVAATSAFGASVKVTAPNGGEAWGPLGAQTIAWSYSGFPESRKVTILLLKDGTQVGTIASNIPIGTAGAGSWAWQPIGTCQGGFQAAAGPGYRVRIQVEGASAIDQSDQPFTIVALKPIGKTAFHPITLTPGNTKVIRQHWMPGETSNKCYTCPYKVGFEQGTGTEYKDPGPGTVQVGFSNGADNDGHYWGETHRCWVHFKVDFFKGYGVLKKAYVQLGEKIRCVNLDVDLLCKCEKLYVLTAPWNGDPDVLMHTTQISPAPDDLTLLVAQWIEHPETNYGFVYISPSELALGCTHNNAVCINEYKGITLHVEIEEDKDKI